jgi:signal transduction histidine kinase
MRRSPRAFDVALALVVALLAVTEILASPDVSGPRLAGVPIALAMGAVLIWRRRHPVAMAALLLALATVEALWIASPSDLLGAYFALLVLAYGAGAFAEGRPAYAGLGLLLLAVWVVDVLAQGSLEDYLVPSVITVLSFIVGRNVRLRTRLAAELHEAAARLAEQRESEAREAVAEERRRIAREMHDVVAHSISIMVVQAAGARQILPTDPGRAEEAAARIAGAGRDALAEMELLVGALEAVGEQGPARTLDGLPALADRARDAGVPVTLAIRGTPAALPAGAELAAYRVVQEALTNTIKHAGCAPATVTVDWTGPALELRVADRGSGSRAPALPAGAGHGLVGMAERVRVYGGELHAGPLPAGGFEVVARLPLAAPAAAAP